MRAIVTVVGKDAQWASSASVCQALAGYNVNILDISQTVMQGYFTMMMVVDVEKCTLPVAILAEEMERKGSELGLQIHVQREDIFNAMHRL